MTNVAQREVKYMQKYIEKIENTTDQKELTRLTQDAMLSIGTFGNAQRARLKALTKNETGDFVS